MAWSGSEVFRAFVHSAFTDANDMDLSADTIKAALYDNDITPGQDVTAANSAYNADQWANTNEVSDTGQWDAGGVALTSLSVDQATAATVFFDAANTSSGTSATLADVYGCLVYDDSATTVADQGICFNYFGGVQAVTDGTFTVIWDSNGIFRFTL